MTIPLILTPGEARLCALEPNRRARIEAQASGWERLRRAFDHARRKRQRRVASA